MTEGKCILLVVKPVAKICVAVSLKEEEDQYVRGLPVKWVSNALNKKAYPCKNMW